MSVVEFENMKIRQQEIEVRALVALLKYGTFRKDGIFQEEAEEALWNIAFPNKLAEKINQTKLGLE
jgi:hypothetical protein